MLTVVVAVQREQFVTLEGPVHVHRQFHIFRTQGGDAEANLQTAVAHRSEVGQQLVVGEGWHRHVIHIEQIGGLRTVVVQAHHDTALPQGDVETHVKRTFDLPFQVGVGITDDTECHRRRAVHRHDTVRLYQLHRVVRVDTRLVSR